jgi:parallel beta-helix repeat protein
MRRRDLQTLVLTALFLSLSCPAVVQAGDWVERSDAPYAGGYGEDASYMFNWFDKSDLSTHIVINEIEQNPYGTDAGNEWVELYNPTTSDVNLDGWKLSTMHGKTVTVTLRGTIPANGYFIYAHTEQWLDNEVESVILRDPSLNGIDRTPYLPDRIGLRNSWQRYPNGKDTDSDSDWEFRASTKGYGSGGEMPPPKTIYVDDDFVDDPPNHKWNTIQEGVNAAFRGDTIVVRDGIYNENVNVHRRLTIQSENGSNVTIVRAASVYGHVFYVRMTDYVNISGFTVEGATGYSYAGIYLYWANHCNVSYNNASNNWKGIGMWYSRDNIIIDNNASNNSYDLHLSSSSGNTITNNGGSIHLDSSCSNKITNNCDGIHLDSSCSNTIANNTCSNHYMGIHLSSSSGNALIGNTLSNNSRGISLCCSSNNNTLTGNNASNNECGIYLSHSGGNTLTSNTADANSDDGIRVSGSGKNDYNNSIDTTNTVNSKPVYYFFDENGIVLDGLGAGHLTLAYCSDCTIKNSNVSNGDGIWLEHSSNNILTSNTANLNSGYGIYLSSSSNNTLTSNLMSDNRYKVT